MSTNKYKNEISRLGDMLESTFQEVQYYKKKDTEGEILRQKLQMQVDRLRDENHRLAAERDYLQAHPRPPLDERQSHTKIKIEDGSGLLNKSKIYMEKVGEIIKVLAEQIKSKKRSRSITHEDPESIISLERSFAKASIGVIKYQQEFMRQAVEKETMKVELDKLRKENTSLFEMTSQLQQNFGETDRIMKKMNQQNKKLLQLVETLQIDKQSLQRAASVERLNRRHSSRKRDATYAHDAHAELENRIRFLEDENQLLRRDKEREHKEKDTFSFRRKSQSSELQASQQHQLQKRALMRKNELLSDQIKTLTEQLHHSSARIKEMEAQLNRNLGTQADETVDYYRLKVEQLQKEISRKGEQIRNLSDQIDSSEAEKDKIITVYQNESLESKDKIIRHQDALKEMEKLAKSLKTKNEQLNKQTKSLLKELSEKNEDLSNQREVVEELEKAKQQYEAEITQLREQLNQKKLLQDLSISDSETQKAATQEQISALEDSIRKYVADNEKLESELQENQLKAREQIGKLKKQNDQLQAQCYENQRKCEVLEADLSLRQQSLLEAEGTIRSINKILNEMTESWGVEDTEKLLNSLNDKLKKQSQHIMDLTLYREKVINQQKSNQISFNQEKNVLVYERDCLKETNQKMIEGLVKIFSLKAPSEEGVAETWEAIRCQLCQQMQGIKKERSKIEQFEKGWWEKEQQLTRQISESKNQIQRLNEKLSEVSLFQKKVEEEEQEAPLHRELQAAQQRVEDLQQQLNSAKQDSEQKDGKIKQQNSLISSLKQSSQQNAKTIQDLTEKLQNAVKSVAQHEQLNQELEEQLEALKLQNDEEYQRLEDNAFQLRQDYDQVCLQLQEEQNVSDSFREKIKALTNYIQRLNKNREDMKAMVRQQFTLYQDQIKTMITSSLQQLRNELMGELREKSYQLCDQFLMIETTMNHVDYNISNKVIQDLLFDESSREVEVEEANSTQYYRKQLGLSQNNEERPAQPHRQTTDRIKEEEAAQKQKSRLMGQIAHQKEIESLQTKIVELESEYRANIKIKQEHIQDLELRLAISEKQYIEDCERIVRERKKFEEELRQQQLKIENFTKREGEFVQNQQKKIDKILQESSEEALQWQREKKQHVEVLNRSVRAIENTNQNMFANMMDKMSVLEQKYCNVQQEIELIRIRLKEKNQNKGSETLKNIADQESYQQKAEQAMRRAAQAEKKFEDLKMSEIKAKAQRELLHGKVSALEASIKEDQQKFDSLSEAHQQLIEIHGNLKEQHESATARLMSVVAEASVLQQRETEMQQEIHHLMQMHKKVKQEKKERKEAEGMLKQKIEKYERQLQIKESEVQRMQKFLLDKNQEITLLRSELLSYQQKDQLIAQLKDQIGCNTSRRSFTTVQQQSFSLRSEKDHEESETRIKAAPTTLKNEKEGVSVKEQPTQLNERNLEQAQALESLRIEIQQKEAKLTEKETFIQQRIKILNDIEEKLKERGQVKRASDEKEPETEEHQYGIKPYVQKATEATENTDLYLGINLEENTRTGEFSCRSRVQQQTKMELKISEDLREILQTENKNLKKQLIRKNKQGAQLKEAEKLLTHLKREVERMSGELKLKEKAIARYDSDARKKSEEMVRVNRNMENLKEELELQKKRNKNFEELYEKYRVQKKAETPQAETS